MFEVLRSRENQQEVGKEQLWKSQGRNGLSTCSLSLDQIFENRVYALQTLSYKTGLDLKAR